LTDKIKEVMSQVLEFPVDRIQAETSPEHVERWDSLKHIQLILALEEEFSIMFPDDAVPNLLTYGAIEAAISELNAPV
jgi:acyl carrier protein